MDVRVDEITSVRFVRGPYPFPSFPGREVLAVQFLGPAEETVLNCYVHDLYDSQQQMRPEKLEAWRALRERYGNRDESGVDPPGPGCLNHRGPQPAHEGRECLVMRAFLFAAMNAAASIVAALGAAFTGMALAHAFVA